VFYRYLSLSSDFYEKLFMPPLTKSPVAMFAGYPSIRTYVHPSVHGNGLCFLCNCLSDCHEIFTKGASTHAECFNDHYVIGYVVWQPCWKKGKTFDLCISETTRWTKLKLGTCEVLLMWNKCDVYIFSDVRDAFVKTS